MQRNWAIVNGYSKRAWNEGTVVYFKVLHQNNPGCK